MDFERIKSRLDALLESGRKAELRGALNMLNEVDIAEYLETLDNEKVLMVFRLLPKDISAEVFSYMDNDQRTRIMEALGDEEAMRIIDDMFKAIGEQTVTVPGTLMAETIIPSIAHDIKTIRDRRREVDRQVEKLLEDHPLLTVLTSMPGIGVRTASNILLGIGGDIANFKSSAHLAAYAGISPATGQSGTSIKGERPSRRGNKRLKNALWQTAFVASTKHPPSVAYYKRKREQGKHHNAAIICLARRRCDVIYSMLKNGTLYQEPALVA